MPTLSVRNCKRLVVRGSDPGSLTVRLEASTRSLIIASFTLSNDCKPQLGPRSPCARCSPFESQILDSKMFIASWDSPLERSYWESQLNIDGNYDWQFLSNSSKISGQKHSPWWAKSAQWTEISVGSNNAKIEAASNSSEWSQWKCPNERSGLTSGLDSGQVYCLEFSSQSLKLSSVLTCKTVFKFASLF